MSRARLNGSPATPGSGLTPSAKAYIGAVKEAMAASTTPLAEVNIEDYRKMCDGYAEQSGPVADDVVINYMDLDIGDGVSLKTTIFDVAGEEDDIKPVLIWIPGGGFISYLVGCHDSSCSNIAARSGYRVMLVHPRLAPEYKAPIPLHDVCAAVTTIYDQAEKFHIDATRIALGGDSSGANLSLGCAMEFRDALKAGKSAPVLEQLVLLSGTYDLTLSVRTPEMTAFERHDFMGDESFEYMFSHYVPEGMKRSDPIISPWYRDLAGLPPMLFSVAEYDGVRSQTDAMIRRSKEEGINFEYHLLPGQTHSCFLLRGVMPDGVDPAMVIAVNLQKNHALQMAARL